LGKTIAIIQARVSSERFPGKVLQPLPADSGVPMVRRIVESVTTIKEIHELIIATTTDKTDDPLVSYCKDQGIKVFRGSVDNVLSRFCEVSELHSAETVVRLTGDNPFLDTDALRACIQYHQSTGNDYTNTKGLPIGMNCEVISASALKTVCESMGRLSREEKEHVTLKFLNDSRFRISTMKVELPKEFAGIRLTVDYVSDYLLMNVLFQLRAASDKQGAEFIDEIRKSHSWLFEANRDNVQKKQFNSFSEEKKEAIALLDRYDMNRISGFLKKADG
jgi:spore coat polysaccharide biosynthesis protein SpsF